eukprot:gene7812-5523_t
MQQRDRMVEGWAVQLQGETVVGGKMARFPFPVTSMPTDNILFSCCVEEVEKGGSACNELTSSAVQVDYDQFASDHIPVEATFTSKRSGGVPLKVVSWNIGGSDLTYFYGAHP